ncbi:hypothetical protein HK096_011561, partial [Nowakowskiella sp. JEL0078]
LRNEEVERQIQKLINGNETLENELKDLNSGEPPLFKENREHGVLLADKEKFRQYLESMELKKQKLISSRVKLKEELLFKENELKELSESKAEIQKIVDSQEISQADVDRMNAERDQLTKTRDQLSEKSTEVSKEQWEKEISLQKKMDQIDKLVETFNSMAHKLRLLPDETSYIQPQSSSYDYQTHGEARPLITELKFNAQATRSEKMLTLDLRNSIKPMLSSHKQQINASVFKVQEESIALQETLDKLNETHAEKLDVLQTKMLELKKLDERFEEMKLLIGKESSTSNLEMEGIDREIQNIKAENSTLLIVAQERLLK